jgi:membrane fusion protein, multidrug efflux system
MFYKSNFSLLFLLLIVGCGTNNEPQENPEQPRTIRSIPVMTAKVTRTTASNKISAPGIVLSENEAKPAFKTGGIIRLTLVKEGDYVKKGQLLATLILTEIDAQLKQAEEAGRKAERDLDRVKALYADSVATLEQLQNVTTGNEIAMRTLEIARFNRAYSEIRSPIAGRVVKQMLYEGEIAAPGMPVYFIMGTQSKDWKIVAGINDKDWANVRIGDKAIVSFDAWPDKVLEADLKEKASVTGKGSGTLDITLKLKTFPSELAAGMICDVNITHKNADQILVIPVEAIVKSTGRNASVYIIENGLAKSVNVITGPFIAQNIAVLSGLKEQDEVITTGAQYVEDGDKVTITNK